MSRILSNVNAHHEPARKVEAANALTVAEQYIRKMVGTTTRDRIAKADASRIAAKPPASGMNDTPFVALADIPGGGSRGAIEHLEAHGISVGVKDGVLSLRRLYLPSATSLLSQMGGRS